MTTKALAAWVLHKRWSGDTSANVFFFTRELGLVDCLCRGGRTPKKQSLLQAFTPLWLAVDNRYDRYYARTIESTAPSLTLHGHCLFSGLYINELLYYTLRPTGPEPELFDAYCQTINGLSCEKALIEPMLRRFEWVLLKACGASFSFTQEAKSGQAICSDLVYRFIAGEGFITAPTGIPGEHLLALSEDNLSTPEHLKSAKFIMRQAISHLLDGREIKARSFF